MTVKEILVTGILDTKGEEISSWPIGQSSGWQPHHFGERRP